ncbi:MAG: glycosyltransferase family 4 protein [Flavobacteriales bacterium]|nr:glycosyltransferase family 4 protein [Flavobacteriales bacterium]
MKIAINTRLLLKDKLEGIGWYTYEIVKRMVKQHPEHDFYFLFDRPFSANFLFEKNVKPIVLSPAARHPFLWYWWFEFSVAKFLSKNNIDLFFSPDGYLSLNAKVNTVLTIHDLNFEYFPEQLPFLTRKYYQYFTPKFAKKANAIITVSKQSKKDIIEQYGIEKEKISAIYNGANKLYKPLEETKKKEVKDKYANGSDYFYFVGSLHPRKNIINLMKAFNQFCEQTKSDVKLLVIGEPMWKNDNTKQVFEQLEHKKRILFLGRKDIKELSKIAASAIALTFVPHFEGFGIPLAEAMFCHSPIITSDVSCLPEIAGNTAIYANPNDIDSIANTMKEMYINNEKREELIENCKIRKNEFSWDKAANEVWEILEQNLPC